MVHEFSEPFKNIKYIYKALLFSWLTNQVICQPGNFMHYHTGGNSYENTCH